MKHHAKKEQLNEGEIALRREETARKQTPLSEKLDDEKVRLCPILISFFRSNASYQAETINRLLKK
jgi:hypothetical protein